MEKQPQDTLGIFELSSEELEQVSGGIMNSQTEAFHAFFAGMIVGYMKAGGDVLIGYS